METIISTILGSGALFTFIQFLITRYDKRKEKKIEEIYNRLDGISLSQYRTEMLVMMNHYQTETIEILRLAQKYFTSGGDFYMTKLFAKWLKANNIPKPLWFNEND